MGWRLSGLFLVLALALTACGGQGSWQEQYDLGIRYLSEGNYEEAILAFTAAIEIDPNQAEAYLGRGDAYIGRAEAATPEGAEDLEGEALSAYESALADLLRAIDLAPLTVQAYERAAQVYAALGYLDAAIAILERGIEATGDAGLQAALEGWKREQTLTVLTYQAAYRPDGTLCAFQYYDYNEQGYQIRTEFTHCDETGAAESTYIDQWEYDGEPGHCWHIPDRQGYDSEEAWRAEWQEEWHEPGTHDYWTSSTGGDYSICVDPLLYKDTRESVSETGDVLSNENASESESQRRWATAVYTFDEVGHPVAITSYYEDGTISGTAVLEWTVIEPVEEGT